MGILQALAVGIMLLSLPSSGEQRFLDWWQRYDEQMTMDRGEEQDNRFRRVLRFAFSDLPEYREPLQPPSEAGELGKVFLLYNQQNFTLLLATPKDTLNGMMSLDDIFKQALKRCGGDHAWLVALPMNSWTEVALNPYCSMDYGTDGIQIDLYWTKASLRPLVDIVTDGRSCVPHVLFGWDASDHRYQQLAEKCTGSKTFESYPDAGTRLQQVF